MKNFVSTHTYHHLNIDARVKPNRARVKLNIVDKKDPDTWYMTFSKNKVDNFITYIQRRQEKLTASIYVHVRGDAKLSFAKSGSASCEQIFDGVLFAAGNEQMQKLNAIETELEGDDLLRITIIPSEFWYTNSRSQNAHYAGNKVGFRFVMRDREDNLFFSHDPMIILPDWETN